MINFRKDLNAILKRETSKKIIAQYERGFLTLDETIKSIYEAYHEETIQEVIESFKEA